MFLVEKTSHFKSFTKHKPSSHIRNPKHYQSFDDKIISYFKTLTLANHSSGSVITLTWMSNAVKFLTAIHSEAHDHIFTRSESECFNVMYMDYTLKVLDLCNLMTSSLKEMTQVKMLLKMSLRLLMTSSPEKMMKGKDALIRCLNLTGQSRADEKRSRADDLIKDLAAGVKKLPVGSGSGSDLIRVLTGLGSLTIVIARVLISILYGTSLTESDFRVSNEFSWADSVNAVRSQLVDQIGLSEIEDITKLGVNLFDVIDDVMVNGDGDEKKDKLENGVEELGEKVCKFTEGVDELTNGVDCWFRCVMKTRNGVLDGVRKGGVW